MGKGEGGFFPLKGGAKTNRIFFVLPLQGQPLADIPTTQGVGTRLVRKAAFPENLQVIFELDPRLSVEETLHCHVLRTAGRILIQA